MLENHVTLERQRVEGDLIQSAVFFSIRGHGQHEGSQACHLPFKDCIADYCYVSILGLWREPYD